MRKFIILFLISPCVLHAQKIEVPRIDSLLLNLEQENNGMGANISIFHQGIEIYHGASGMADIGNSIRSDNGTKYGIASISKIYTATIIMKLIEQGKLSLETPVGKYYPLIKNSDKVTITNLLSHTSGIGIHGYNGRVWEHSLANLPDAKEKIYERMAAISGQAPPGLTYSYNNANYMLLAWIAADAGGASFPELLERLIFTPLGITGTYPGTRQVPRLNEALPYVKGEDGWVQHKQNRAEVTLGAAHIVSSASELNRFLYALMSGKIITVESVEKMVTPVKNRYGYGIQRLKWKGHILYGHSGGSPAYSSLAFYWPEKDITLCVLLNARCDHTSFQIAYKALDIITNELDI